MAARARGGASRRGQQQLSATAKRRAQRAARRTIVVVPGVTSGAETEGTAGTEAALTAVLADCGQRSQVLAERLALEQRKRQQVQSQLAYERSAANAAEANANEAELARAEAEREAAAQVTIARLANDQLRDRLAAEEAARRQSERDLAQLRATSAAIVELETRAAQAERAQADAEAALKQAEAAAEAARLAMIAEKAVREALECKLEHQSEQLESAPLAESPAGEDPNQSDAKTAEAEQQSDTDNQKCEVPLEIDRNGSDAVDKASSSEEVERTSSNHSSTGVTPVEPSAQPEPKEGIASRPTDTTNSQPVQGTVANSRSDGRASVRGDHHHPRHHQQQQHHQHHQHQQHQHQHQHQQQHQQQLQQTRVAEQQRLNDMVANGLHKLLAAEGSARDALSLHSGVSATDSRQEADQEPQWIKRTGGVLGKEERWTKRAPYGTRPAHTNVATTELALYKLGAEVRQLWRQFDQQSNRPRRRIL
eukprot:COSAG02_NODE_6370_length_3619_cov_86.835227_1_plen_481_part_00